MLGALNPSRRVIAFVYCHVKANDDSYCEEAGKVEAEAFVLSLDQM